PHLPSQLKQASANTQPAPTSANAKGEYVLPWTKVSYSGNTTQSSVNDEAFLPNSSMSGSTRATNTTGGQILSMGKPQKWGLFIPILRFLFMLICPLVLLTYGSYNDWNLPFKIPIEIKAITDQTLVSLPITP